MKFIKSDKFVIEELGQYVHAHKKNTKIIFDRFSIYENMESSILAINTRISMHKNHFQENDKKKQKNKNSERNDSSSLESLESSQPLESP